MDTSGFDNRLSIGTLLRIFFRSFFLQGSFSTRLRQNVGFAFCIEPAADALWNDPEDNRRFLARHTEYFNGNPFMVTLILGAVAHLEERLRFGGDVNEDDIRRFKKIAGPATGSVGDRFFWSNLRPFMLIIGIITAYFTGIWGAAVFLAAFNIPMIALKWHWLIEGYRLGPNVAERIKSPVFEEAERVMEIAGSLLVAFISIPVLIGLTGAEYSFRWISAGALGFFLTGLVMLKRNMPLHKLFPAAILISVTLCLVMDRIFM
jgi:PTS system mannose-specific IID component